MSFNGFSDNTVTGTVSNDGFWPDLGTGQFQGRYRLPAEYEQDMVEDHLQLAMLWANRQLVDWKVSQKSIGYHTLSEVSGISLGDDTEYLILYRRAVYCHAKALLLKQFATVNRRDAAKNEAKESEETEDKFQEFAQAAIADFLNMPRIGVHDL